MDKEQEIIFENNKHNMENNWVSRNGKCYTQNED